MFLHQGETLKVCHAAYEKVEFDIFIARWVGDYFFPDTFYVAGASLTSVSDSRIGKAGSVFCTRDRRF